MRYSVPMGSALVTALTLTFGILAPRHGAAQTSEVSVEMGASRILPPDGVEGDGADFLVGGIRASTQNLSSTGVWGSFLLGRALNATAGGDFLSGELGGAWSSRPRHGWSADLMGRASGFRVAAPFEYEAASAEAAVGVRYRLGPISTRLAGLGGVGRSRVVLSSTVQRMRHRAPVREVMIDDLWRYGATLEVLVGRGPIAVGVAGGTHESAGGSFRSAGARLVAAGRRGAIELRVDAWHTPEGSRNTGGIVFWVPWGPWSVRGTAGKPEPDPLLLAEPGRGAGGMLVGRTIFGRAPASRRVSLHEVVKASSEEARVRFTVDAPRGAERVELLGDFTLWKPVPMKEVGRTWSLEMEVPPGTYHFGFQVDGAWYLPEGAADAVPDEWGRRSATLVIEGEAGS